MNLNRTVELAIAALEAPELCGEILSVTNDSILKSLESKGVIFGDQNFKNDLSEPRISILTGSDDYWNVTSGKVKHICSFHAAVQTIVGWFSQGPIKVSNASNLSTQLLCSG